MSIVVNNTGNQLNVTNNGVLDVYAVQSIKSIGRGIDSSGNYYVSINFIANDKNNSFRIYLKDVSSPSTWTNDNSGVNTALSDLRGWLSSSSSVSSNANLHDGSGTPITSTPDGLGNTGIDVNIIGGTGVQRTPAILRTSANSSVAAGAYSVSFASVGTTNATVGGAVLKPGETINFDAGAVNNTLGSIAYNSSASGAELLIITLT